MKHSESVSLTLIYVEIFLWNQVKKINSPKQHFFQDERCYLPKLYLPPLTSSLFFQDFRLEVKGTMQVNNRGFNYVFLKPRKKTYLNSQEFWSIKARTQTTQMSLKIIISINNV